MSILMLDGPVFPMRGPPAGVVLPRAPPPLPHDEGAPEGFRKVPVVPLYPFDDNVVLVQMIRRPGGDLPQHGVMSYLGTRDECVNKFPGQVNAWYTAMVSVYGIAATILPQVGFLEDEKQRCAPKKKDDMDDEEEQPKVNESVVTKEETKAMQKYIFGDEDRRGEGRLDERAAREEEEDVEEDDEEMADVESIMGQGVDEDEGGEGDEGREVAGGVGVYDPAKSVKWKKEILQLLEDGVHVQMTAMQPKSMGPEDAMVEDSGVRLTPSLIRQLEERGGVKDLFDSEECLQGLDAREKETQMMVWLEQMTQRGWFLEHDRGMLTVSVKLRVVREKVESLILEEGGKREEIETAAAECYVRLVKTLKVIIGVLVREEGENATGSRRGGKMEDLKARVKTVVNLVWEPQHALIAQTVRQVQRGTPYDVVDANCDRRMLKEVQDAITKGVERSRRSPLTLLGVLPDCMEREFHPVYFKTGVSDALKINGMTPYPSSVYAPSFEGGAATGGGCNGWPIRPTTPESDCLFCDDSVIAVRAGRVGGDHLLIAYELHHKEAMFLELTGHGMLWMKHMQRMCDNLQDIVGTTRSGLGGVVFGVDADTSDDSAMAQRSVVTKPSKLHADDPKSHCGTAVVVIPCAYSTAVATLAVMKKRRGLRASDHDWHEIVSECLAHLEFSMARVMESHHVTGVRAATVSDFLENCVWQTSGGCHYLKERGMMPYDALEDGMEVLKWRCIHEDRVVATKQELQLCLTINTWTFTVPIGSPKQPHYLLAVVWGEPSIGKSMLFATTEKFFAGIIPPEVIKVYDVDRQHLTEHYNDSAGSSMVKQYPHGFVVPGYGGRFGKPAVITAANVQHANLDRTAAKDDNLFTAPKGSTSTDVLGEIVNQYKRSYSEHWERACVANAGAYTANMGNPCMSTLCVKENSSDVVVTNPIGRNPKTGPGGVIEKAKSGQYELSNAATYTRIAKSWHKVTFSSLKLLVFDNANAYTALKTHKEAERVMQGGNMPDAVTMQTYFNLHSKSLSVATLAGALLHNLRQRRRLAPEVMQLEEGCANIAACIAQWALWRPDPRQDFWMRYFMAFAHDTETFTGAHHGATPQTMAAKRTIGSDAHCSWQKKLQLVFLGQGRPHLSIAMDELARRGVDLLPEELFEMFAKHMLREASYGDIASLYATPLEQNQMESACALLTHQLDWNPNSSHGEPRKVHEDTDDFIGTKIRASCTIHVDDVRAEMRRNTRMWMPMTEKTKKHDRVAELLHDAKRTAEASQGDAGAKLRGGQSPPCYDSHEHHLYIMALRGFTEAAMKNEHIDIRSVEGMANNWFSIILKSSRDARYQRAIQTKLMKCTVEVAKTGDYMKLRLQLSPVPKENGILSDPTIRIVSGDSENELIAAILDSGNPEDTAFCFCPVIHPNGLPLMADDGGDNNPLIDMAPLKNRAVSVRRESVAFYNQRGMHGSRQRCYVGGFFAGLVEGLCHPVIKLLNQPVYAFCLDRIMTMAKSTDIARISGTRVENSMPKMVQMIHDDMHSQCETLSDVSWAVASILSCSNDLGGEHDETLVTNVSRLYSLIASKEMLTECGTAVRCEYQYMLRTLMDYFFMQQQGVQGDLASSSTARLHEAQLNMDLLERWCTKRQADAQTKITEETRKMQYARATHANANAIAAIETELEAQENNLEALSFQGVDVAAQRSLISKKGRDYLTVTRQGKTEVEYYESQCQQLLDEYQTLSDSRDEPSGEGDVQTYNVDEKMGEILARLNTMPLFTPNMIREDPRYADNLLQKIGDSINRARIDRVGEAPNISSELANPGDAKTGLMVVGDLFQSPSTHEFYGDRDVPREDSYWASDPCMANRALSVTELVAKTVRACNANAALRELRREMGGKVPRTEEERESLIRLLRATGLIQRVHGKPAPRSSTRDAASGRADKRARLQPERGLRCWALNVYGDVYLVHANVVFTMAYMLGETEEKRDELVNSGHRPSPPGASLATMWQETLAVNDPVLRKRVQWTLMQVMPPVADTNQAPLNPNLIASDVGALPMETMPTLVLNHVDPAAVRYQAPDCTDPIDDTDYRNQVRNPIYVSWKDVFESPSYAMLMRDPNSGIQN